MGCMAEKKIIFVKVGRMGERVQEMAYTEGVLLYDALTGAGIVLAHDDRVFVNDARIETVGGYILHMNSIVLIKKAEQAKMITVRVGRVGQSIRNITIKDGSTVKECLILAGMLPFTNEEIWLHEDENHRPGYKVDDKRQMRDGFCIILEQKRDEKKCAILRIMAECFEEVSGDELDWEDIPTIYADRIIAIK